MNEDKKTVTKQDDTTTLKDVQNDTTTLKEVPAPVPVVDPDADKRLGVKNAAENSEGMAVEKAKDEPEKDALPSFFVTKAARHRVEVDILSSKKDGRIMSVSRVGLGLDFKQDFSYLRHDESWFDFSLPNYEDMSTYRQRSAKWVREAQQTVIDKLQLRNFLLVWHLKDWSIADAEGRKVVLEHEANGALTDESVAKVYAVNPTLVDVVLTLLEKDVLLS